MARWLLLVEFAEPSTTHLILESGFIQLYIIIMVRFCKVGVFGWVSTMLEIAQSAL